MMHRILYYALGRFTLNLWYILSLSQPYNPDIKSNPHWRTLLMLLKKTSVYNRSVTDVDGFIVRGILFLTLRCANHYHQRHINYTSAFKMLWDISLCWGWFSHHPQNEHSHWDTNTNGRHNVSAYLSVVAPDVVTTTPGTVWDNKAVTMTTSEFRCDKRKRISESQLTPIALCSLRGHFVYAPSQWETTSHCNVVSHWLGAYTKCSLPEHIYAHLH